MSYQGTATISRIAEELADEIQSAGFDFVTPGMIASMLHESDVLSTRNWDCWVDWAACPVGQFGSEDYPHLVYCQQSAEPGSAVSRSYIPIA